MINISDRVSQGYKFNLGYQLQDGIVHDGSVIAGVSSWQLRSDTTSEMSELGGKEANNSQDCRKENEAREVRKNTVSKGDSIQSWWTDISINFLTPRLCVYIPLYLFSGTHCSWIYSVFLSQWRFLWFFLP